MAKILQCGHDWINLGTSCAVCDANELAALKAENLKLKAIAIVADELLRDLKVAWGNQAEAAMTGNKFEHLENLLRGLNET